MPRADGLAVDASSNRAGESLFAARAGEGWLVVRALGRELRIRNERRVAGARSSGAGLVARGTARGGMAAFDTECRRRFRRDCIVVLRPVAQGARKEHGVADGVGADWLAGCGQRRRSK